MALILNMCWLGLSKTQCFREIGRELDQSIWYWGAVVKFYGRGKTKKVEVQEGFSKEVMPELWLEEWMGVNDAEKESGKVIKQRFEEEGG